MRSTIAAFLICMACGQSAEALADNIGVANIATRIVEGPDSGGDVSFAIRCTLRNNENRDVKAFVTLQAVDADGFELTSVTLVGKLKAGESKNVSHKTYMPARDYKKVTWQVKD